MQKIYAVLISFFCLCALHINAQDLAELDDYEKAMKPGVQLTYDVTAKEKNFKMVVTIKKLGDEVSFSWKTSDPDNKSGSVTMSNSAISTAKAFSNVFNGSDNKLDKETSLWVSKQVCTDVTGAAQTSVKINGASDTVTVMGNTMSVFNFTLNGTGVSLSGWELEGGNPKRTIDVLESLKFPLIYKLDLGWTMVLTDIKN